MQSNLNCRNVKMKQQWFRMRIERTKMGFLPNRRRSALSNASLFFTLSLYWVLLPWLKLFFLVFFSLVPSRKWHRMSFNSKKKMLRDETKNKNNKISKLFNENALQWVNVGFVGLQQRTWHKTIATNNRIENNNFEFTCIRSDWQTHSLYKPATMQLDVMLWALSLSINGEWFWAMQEELDRKKA